VIDAAAFPDLAAASRAVPKEKYTQQPKERAEREEDGASVVDEGQVTGSELGFTLTIGAASHVAVYRARRWHC
jgi:hypothetical protein